MTPVEGCLAPVDAGSTRRMILHRNRLASTAAAVCVGGATWQPNDMRVSRFIAIRRRCGPATLRVIAHEPIRRQDPVDCLKGVRHRAYPVARPSLRSG